ncbi:MAG: pyruvate ferredoxin oxidoreductase, partial [Chloroflexi bacterium]|nr:pyruvate ferredoxin oxidoreductase [Chloroflexota bacterium]
WDFTDYYFEHKRQQSEAINNAMPIILDVFAEYERLSERPQRILDCYGMEDADYALVVLSSTAGTARSVARKLRAEGKKVGILKPTLYRPFPAQEIVDCIKNCKAVAVLDRAISFGTPLGMGPLFTDITAALFGAGVSGLPIVNYIYGLGGRDTTPPMIESAFADLEAIAASGDRGDVVRYLGLRG